MVTNTSKTGNWVLIVRHTDCRGHVARTWDIVGIDLQTTKITMTWGRNYPSIAGTKATNCMENMSEKVPHNVVENRDDGFPYNSLMFVYK